MLQTHAMPPTELLTCAEVAARFRRTPETIRDWTREGRLRAINRPGKGRLLYRSEDIDRLTREMAS